MCTPPKKKTMEKSALYMEDYGNELKSKMKHLSDMPMPNIVTLIKSLSANWLLA